MTDSNSQSTLTQALLRQAITGDPAAVDALLRHSSTRLHALARRMLGSFGRVRRWADSDDVLQSALMRLLAALRDVRPTTPRAFLALATLQIRRELLDLARQLYGPHGIGTRHDSHGAADARGPAGDRADSTLEPGALAQWTELHEAIDRLPDEEREVVGLLFYQGLPQSEAAALLQMPLRTLQRRWHDALCKLHRVWNAG